MDIQTLQETSYETSASKGFHHTDSIQGILVAAGIDISNNLVRRILDLLEPRWAHMQDSLRLMLVIGEVIEAHEELRAGHAPAEIYEGDKGKPEGVPIELADAMIRLGDYASARSIDLTDAIETKAAYNAGRPYMHGKQF